MLSVVAGCFSSGLSQRNQGYAHWLRHCAPVLGEGNLVVCAKNLKKLFAETTFSPQSTV